MGSLFQVDGFLYRSINKIMDVIKSLLLLYLQEEQQELIKEYYYQMKQ